MPKHFQHVVALDPGGRSGWASAQMSEDKLHVTGFGVLRQDLMARWLADKQAVSYLFAPVGGRAFDVIVCESWRPRRKDGKMDWIEGDPLLSAQHVGQIRLIADLSKSQYVEYAPKQKPVWTASMPHRLKVLDAESGEQHDQDARMHLWGYFFENWFTGSVDPEDLVIG